MTTVTPMKISNIVARWAKEATARYDEVKSFIGALNAQVQRDLWIPMPVPPSAADLQYMQLPLTIKRQTILAIFRDSDLQNYLKVRPAVVAQLDINPVPYTVFEGIPLHENRTGEYFQVLNKYGMPIWLGQQKTNKCRTPHIYAVVDMGGTLMVQCLDTGLIPSDVVLRRVGALTKNGRTKDPRDLFTNQAQISLLSTMCKTCGFLTPLHRDGDTVTGGEFDYSRLSYPDMTSIISRAGIAKSVVESEAEVKATKQVCKDRSYGIDCFGRLWVHPMMMDCLFRWTNCTYEPGSVMYMAMLNREDITANEVMKRALANCSPMAKVNISTALYVGAYRGLPNQCKVGISHLSCEALHNEYTRGVPGLDLQYFKCIPKAEEIEVDIKHTYKKDRIPNTSPDALIEKASLSEVYKQPPEVMIRIIKEHDPEWIACVAAGTTDSYSCIETGRYNRNRAEVAMGRELQVVTARTTKTKIKTKEVNGVPQTTTSTSTSTTEYTCIPVAPITKETTEATK